MHLENLSLKYNETQKSFKTQTIEYHGDMNC